METELRTWNLRGAAILVCAIAFCWGAWGAPENDNFSDAKLLTLDQASVTGSNVGATRQAGEPYHAGNLGGASVWWKITPSESGYLKLSTLKSVSTDGQLMDTLLAVYTGSALTNLVLIDANDDDDETGEHGSTLLISVTGGTEYYIAVDGYKFDVYPPDQGRIVLQFSFQKTITYKTAPAWQLTDIQGNLVKSTDFTNKVVLLNFWATWCPPCVAEIPDLITLQDTYGELGLVV